MEIQHPVAGLRHQYEITAVVLVILSATELPLPLQFIDSMVVLKITYPGCRERLEVGMFRVFFLRSNLLKLLYYHRTGVIVT